ncbi:hypothetical protein L6164_021027 [Bauhinia variegata]|uniref:Uncharacterized protein n=1 Tax=Bauhinia variegata TaxID=167791 RepID=A0ACB9MWY5_BAUVA|nr:hypothetical protein L6164_021027 [Bauhinia variegata]
MCVVNTEVLLMIWYNTRSQPKCRGVIEPQFCKSAIPEELFDRWEDAICKNLVLASEKFDRPFEDVGGRWR